MNLSTNKEKYRHFVQEQNDSIPLFFNDKYLDVVAQDNWEGLIIEEDNKVMGVFILHEKIKFGIKTLINPPLSPYTGLWIDKVFQSKTGKIIQLISKYLKDKYIYINFTLHPQFTNHLPWEWEGFHQSQCMTMILSKQNYAEVYNKYHLSLKQDIKHAQKTMQVEEIIAFENEMVMLTSGLKKSGMREARAVAIVQALSKLDTMKIYRAYDQNSVSHGVIMLGVDNQRHYNLINGRSAKASRGAMSLLLDFAIQKTMNDGKIFDFEGSSLTGVYNFFISFSPSIITYHQLYKTRYKITDALVKSMGKV